MILGQNFEIQAIVSRYAICTCAFIAKVLDFFPSWERLGKNYQINPPLFLVSLFTKFAILIRLESNLIQIFRGEHNLGYKTFMNLHSLKYHTNVQLISRDFYFTVLSPSSELQSNLGLRNG